jgi:hypothetical protein
MVGPPVVQEEPDDVGTTVLTCPVEGGVVVGIVVVIVTLEMPRVRVGAGLQQAFDEVDVTIQARKVHRRCRVRKIPLIGLPTSPPRERRRRAMSG